MGRLHWHSGWSDLPKLTPEAETGIPIHRMAWLRGPDWDPIAGWIERISGSLKRGKKGRLGRSAGGRFQPVRHGPNSSQYIGI